MVSQSRKHRGYETQAMVAEYLRTRGYPYAESTGAGRQGSDITGTPGLAIEVKARTGFDPLAWLRQARTGMRFPTDIPAAVFRCNGQGEKSVNEFGVLLTLEDFTNLLDRAGLTQRPE